MDQHSVQVIIETLKEEGVDLAVTLPEEPTFSLTEAMREDPFFQAVTVAGEGNGLAFCAGAALGGRRVVFVTGIADQQAGDAGHEHHPPSAQRGAGAKGKTVAFAGHGHRLEEGILPHCFGKRKRGLLGQRHG